MNKETEQTSKSIKSTTRLLKPCQFDWVFTNPNLRVSNNHILLLARQTSLPYARLGLVVAKKKTPLAVNRNRFKRLAREYFRRNKKEIGSFDIVILCRNDISKLSTSEQNQNFSQIFTKLFKNNHAE